MQNILSILILFGLLSCGVKEAPVGGNTPQVSGGTAIEGVLITAEKKFLVRPSRLDLAVDPQLNITYQIVDRNLEALSPGTTLKVKYWMPEMPQMPVTPVKIERLSNSKFQVTYDFSMEGKWELNLSLAEGDQILDTLNFTYEIPAVP